LKNKAKHPPAKGGKASAKAEVRRDKPAAKPSSAKAETKKDSKKPEPPKPVLKGGAKAAVAAKPAPAKTQPVKGPTAKQLAKAPPKPVASKEPLPKGGSEKTGTAKDRTDVRPEGLPVRNGMYRCSTDAKKFMGVDS
jgi:hypothetical protein